MPRCKVLKEKSQAVYSTGLRDVVATGAVMRLMPHNYHQRFRSIKELPGCKRICALFISLSGATWLSYTNSQAATSAASRDKPRH